MKHFFLIFIFALSTNVLFCQDNFISAKTNVRMVERIDSNINFNVFRINPIIHKADNKKVKTKKAFIDIPKDLIFNLFYNQAKTDYFIFDNGNEIIIIKNQYETDSVSNDLNSIVQKINNAAILKHNNIPDLNFNKQSGFYRFENYLVCFFNVDDVNLEKFNSSIKSIRKKH